MSEKLPVETLKLTGQYREDRHGELGSSRNLAFPTDTIIKCPQKFSAKTKKCWEAIVPNLIRQKILTDQDLPSIDMMFTAFEEYLNAQKAIKAFDKENPVLLDTASIDQRRKLNKWLLDSITAFNKVAYKFGITPTERLKEVEDIHTKKSEDPLEIVIGY